MLKYKSTKVKVRDDEYDEFLITYYIIQIFKK